MTAPTSEFQSMSPILKVRDLDRDAAYYAEQLDFAVTWRWGEPAIRAGVARDGLEIQLVEDRDVVPPAEPTLLVYFLMRGVDSYHATCVERGAEVCLALEDRPWGVRDFRVLDPSGNMLGFAEPL